MSYSSLATNSPSVANASSEKPPGGGTEKATSSTWPVRNLLLEGKAAVNVDQLLGDIRYADLTRIWGVDQVVIAAYEDPKKRDRRARTATLIDALNIETIKGIAELRTLARTPRRRRDDILADFTHPYSSNGPTVALNGYLDHLRGIALGFRNLGNYITRSLLHTSGFKTAYPHLCEEPAKTTPSSDAAIIYTSRLSSAPSIPFRRRWPV